MASVIVTRVLKNVGLNMTIYLAALKSIPEEYAEAARVDGASGWRVLRAITLPLLGPTTLFVVIITATSALQVFDHILLMTAGGPENATNVLVYYIYRQAFQFFDIGYASALAVFLFVAALALTLAMWFVRGRAAPA
jgi:multiple sugar transport system permease protein